MLPRNHQRVISSYPYASDLRLNSARNFFYQHFEKILACFVILATLITHFVVLNKLRFLDIFYLPILLTSYILGRRAGISAAIFSVLAVTLSVIISPNTYVEGNYFIRNNYLNLVYSLILWGCFLILTSVVVGTLHERNNEKNNELKQSYEGVLEILSKLIDAADKYTKGHSLRVAEIATDVAIEMNLPDRQIETIRVASLLHDIGKIDISSEVILKAAKLSDEELEEIKSHVDKSGILLKSFRKLFKDAVAIILAHHRYFNGAGYGETLGAELSQGLGILIVVDAYDAMISDRPYRTGITPVEAIYRIEKLAGEQFDPEIVRIFKQVMKNKLEID